MIDFWSVSTKGDDSVRVWSHLNQFKLFCKQYPWVLWHKNKHTDTVNGLILWFSWESKFAYFIIKQHYMAILQTASKLAYMRTQLISDFSPLTIHNYWLNIVVAHRYKNWKKYIILVRVMYSTERKATYPSSS